MQDLGYLSHTSLSPLLQEATEAKSVPRMMATFNMFSETRMLLKKVYLLGFGTKR